MGQAVAGLHRLRSPAQPGSGSDRARPPSKSRHEATNGSSARRGTRGLKTVNLDGLGVKAQRLDEELASILALITLELDHVTNGALVLVTGLGARLGSPVLGFLGAGGGSGSDSGSDSDSDSGIGIGRGVLGGSVLDKLVIVLVLVLGILDDGAVAGKGLLELLEDFLEVKFGGDALNGGQGLPSIALLNADMDILLRSILRLDVVFVGVGEGIEGLEVFD